jgi:autotransporter-associated beta strand protein/T5SS/PEP-CTERM-associated repeat protein
MNILRQLLCFAHWQRGLAAFLAGCLAATAALGQTIWTNPGTGDWNAPSNWSLGVPDANSGTTFDAVIENDGTAQLTTLGASVRRLRVGRAAGGGLLVVDGGGLTVTENFYLDENASGIGLANIQGGASVTAPITVVGYSGDGTAQVTIQGSGTTYEATADFVAGLSGTGIVVLENGGKLSIGGGALPLRIGVNTGSVGQLFLYGDGPILQASGVEFGAGDGAGVTFHETGDLSFSVPISGDGSVFAEAGTTTLSGTHTYTGTTTVSAGTLIVAGNVSSSPTTVNGGALLVTGTVGSSATVNSGGTLGGIGTTGGVMVHSGGVLSPGLTVGTLNTGSLSLDAGAISSFELATPGVVGMDINDLVAVTGSLVLNGQVAITPLTGFGAGTYTLFTYTTIGANLGLSFQPAFLTAHPGSTITLDSANTRVLANITAAKLAGDYNDNGILDAADYTVWRDHLGQSFALANRSSANTGPINAADYDVWKSNFGNHAGSGSGTETIATVPEPTTLVLLMFAVAGWCLNRGRTA